MDLESASVAGLAGTSNTSSPDSASGNPATTYSHVDLVEEIQRCELTSRDALMRQLSLIAEAEQRGLSAWFGAQSMTAWLRELLNLPTGDAKSRVLLARKTTEGEDESGDAVPEELPATAHVLKSGEATIEHGRVIADGIGKLPPTTGSEERNEAEAFLADRARTDSPQRLRVLAERIRHHLDQDGAVRDEQYQLEHRNLHLGTAWDGMTVLTGRLDRETGAKLRAVLKPLAAPRPAENGTKDPRTRGKRNADALDVLLTTTLSGDDLPAAGNTRPQVAVTIDYDDLRQRLNEAAHCGDATLEPTGQPLTAASARRIACDAEILPAVIAGESQPLDIGRSRRTAPDQLRAALTMRDGQCAFPQCEQPPGTSEAHHVHHWADGGTTALNNMVMLCGHHHRVVHDHAWHIDLTGQHPTFTPPARIDPQRQPRASNHPPRFCCNGRDIGRHTPTGRHVG